MNDGTVDVDVDISVTAADNTAPSFDETSYSFSDVAIAVDTVVGTVDATDDDTLSYSLTGTDASTFDIDSDGEITVATELTYGQSYSFNVVADDGTDTTSVGVSVTAEAEPIPAVPTQYQDTYDEDLGYNVLPESNGGLRRVTSAGVVQALGNTWYTDRPYNVSAIRMLSIGDDLHLTVGYGNPDKLLSYNSLASQADNYVHIVFGNTLRYVLPVFTPTQNVYAELADLGKRVNATVSFEKNIIRIADRAPFRALTDGATGTGTGNLAFDGVNKTFPDSGWVIIGEEVIKYTGQASGAFTGVVRGVLGTTITDHADNSRILYLDNVITTNYKSITRVSDTNRVRNIIRDSARTAEVRDDTSITTFSELPFTLDLGLTRHQTQWIESVFDSYIEELKDLQDIFNITIRQDFSLSLGQIVPFFHDETLKAMRVVSIRYSQTDTAIRGRTISI